MINRSSLSDSAQTQLMAIIADLRSRWRMKIALRGAAIVAAAGVFALLVSAIGLERFGFSPTAIIAFRILTYLTIIVLAVRYLIRPVMRNVSDESIALYLEEHEPTLEETVLSALSVGDPDQNAHISRALAMRTIEDAVARCHTIDDGRGIDRRAITRFSTALGGAAALGLGIIFLSPGFLRHGAKAVLNPFGSVASANPYAIEVEPGNVTIPRGADQAVSARLRGFDATQADIVMQTGGDSLFVRLPMNVADSAEFDLLLFALDRDTEYYIESNGIRSPVFRITVADIPYVDGLTLEYHFPEYTGLSPQVIENGGDVAVLRGTTVRVFASTTLPVPGGRIIRATGDTIAMALDSTGVLVGDMLVNEDGFYHIELEGPNVQPSSSSPQYTIEVLDDLPPIVRFTKPGRDSRASSIEEVFVEAKAEDDYGISKLELVYSVNGTDERTITLLDSDRSLKEAIAGHTFYLEEMDLQPGDLIAYYARATDNNAAGEKKTAKSDIYFMTVRPFQFDYQQADQAPQGGGGGGGGQQQQNGQLSEQQREIVAATFNVVRDSASITERELSENLVTIALAQEDLEAQAETLAERMNNRGITNDSSFSSIAELLPQASVHMDSAVNALRDGRPSDALPSEQKALQILQRAEAIYRDVQVAFQQQQGGGGGGGGGSPNAEDLADLFELELDKLRNQYETVQRGQQEQGGAQSDEVDETLERLRELARRQQQENERMRQLSRAGGASGGNSSQRDLAEETEEAARQLERLAREQGRPELEDAARRLREAADAMRRSAANARTGNTTEGQAALDQLEEATRRLQREQQQALSDQAQSALERANQMAREQDEIGDRMDQLSQMNGAERAEEARRLVEEKDQQNADVNELQRDLSQLASAANREDPEAARALREAANSIIENRLTEKIRYSRVNTVAGANREYSRALEEEIGTNIDEVRQQIAQAVDDFSQIARGDAAEESLEDARNLARSLESLEERTRAAQEGRRLGERPDSLTDQQGQGQQGQQGQGQQGQQGQGQQGQQGQGQQGQQGQGQQGQQGQGQQGQQGQGQGQQGQQGQGQQGQQGQGQGQQGQQGQGQQGQQGQGQQGQQGQGQQGQQGQQGSQGQQQQGQAGGGQGQQGGIARGAPDGPGGGADARPGPLTADQVRQFRGEVRQRLQEARQLREELSREGFDVTDLDQVIQDLSRLDDARVYGTPKELALLQAAVVDGVKQFEYRLRRELAGDAEARLLLGGSREVPEGFRKYVDEYYKTLSRRAGGGR
jgi:hypothetical protein